MNYYNLAIFLFGFSISYNSLYIMLILFNDIDLSSIAKLHRDSTCAKKRHGGYPRNGKVNQGYSSNH